jgi:hypothetical protein
VSRADEVPASRKRVTFDDPRCDPTSLAWARVHLLDQADPTNRKVTRVRPDPVQWSEGYGQLILAAGRARPTGWQPRAALAAVERGEAEATTAIERDPSGREFVYQSSLYEPEWAAVSTTARNLPAARAFLRYLSYVNMMSQLWHGPPDNADPDADALLADLLGATLVDAHDELRAAQAAVARAEHPELAAKWLASPLPWPPASVAKILGRESNAMPMLETLAAQVAPEADVRAWLLRSWLSPARPVDGALLAELAGAVDGRLVREPRFRAWLRAEWLASARQRYRRVARLTEWGPRP